MFTSMKTERHNDMKMGSLLHAASRRARPASYVPGQAGGIPSRQSGFTLIEVMVALGIFMLLMIIIFVPLNQAVNTLHSR
jgi:prepilin-type N-terminal cleavage/methylation domain-containing protein